MKWLILVITGLILTIPASAQFRPHYIMVGGGTDTITVTASVKTVQHVTFYQLTIKAPNKQKRVMNLGPWVNENSRLKILKALQDSLHKALLFPPGAPVTFDGTDMAVDILIAALVDEAFPQTNINIAGEKVPDANDTLRLLYQPYDGIYQISLVKPIVLAPPNGRIQILQYDPALLNYQFAWANVNSPMILDHFDLLMQLYFKIPSTAVKPQLFLLPQPMAIDSYELVFSFNGHTISHVPGAPIIVSKEIEEKLATKPVDVYMPGGGHASLLRLIDPDSSEAAKKTKDDPRFVEKQN